MLIKRWQGRQCFLPVDKGPVKVRAILPYIRFMHFIPFQSHLSEFNSLIILSVSPCFAWNLSIAFFFNSPQMLTLWMTVSMPLEFWWRHTFSLKDPPHRQLFPTALLHPHLFFAAKVVLVPGKLIYLQNCRHNFAEEGAYTILGTWKTTSDAFWNQVITIYCIGIAPLFQPK